MPALDSVGDSLQSLAESIPQAIAHAADQEKTLREVQAEIDALLNMILRCGEAIQPRGHLAYQDPPQEFLNDAPDDAPEHLVLLARKKVADEWADYLKLVSTSAGRESVLNGSQHHTVGDYCRFWMAQEAEAAKCRTF